MGGKAPLQEPEGVRSALLDSTRTFTKPMSLAYSRKHCLQMFRLYLRMIPHWFAHTRLLKGRGGRVRIMRLGRVGSGRNVETLENGATHAAPRATGSGPRSRPTTRGRLVYVTHAPIVRRSRRETVARRDGDVEPASRRIDAFAEKTRCPKARRKPGTATGRDTHQRRWPLPLHSCLVAQMLAKPMFAPRYATRAVRR